MPEATTYSNTAKQSTKMKTRNRMNRLRQLIVQVSVKKCWEYLPGPLVQNWTAVPQVGALGSSVPDLGRLLSVSTGDNETRVGTRRKNPKGSSAETARLVLVPTETGKTKKVAQRRLLDWSWSQQKRGKPKSSGDCSTGLGPNRNGENQKAASSAETARLVLVTQPKGKTINP